MLKTFYFLNKFKVLWSVVLKGNKNKYNLLAKSEGARKRYRVLRFE